MFKWKLISITFADKGVGGSCFGILIHMEQFRSNLRCWWSPNDFVRRCFVLCVVFGILKYSFMSHTTTFKLDCYCLCVWYVTHILLWVMGYWHWQFTSQFLLRKWFTAAKWLYAAVPSNHMGMVSYDPRLIHHEVIDATTHSPSWSMYYPAVATVLISSIKL